MAGCLQHAARRCLRLMPPAAGVEPAFAALQSSRASTSGACAATAFLAGAPAAGFSSQTAASGAAGAAQPPALSALERAQGLSGVDQAGPSLVLDKPSSTLGKSDVGAYYQLRAESIAEAFQPFHQTLYAKRPAHMQRRGGCRGLQDEVAFSGSNRIMYRRCMHELFKQLAQPGSRLLLDGPTGSGKSVALAAAVERARAQGTLALYIPSATSLVYGGFFTKRPGAQLWDTVLSAQHVLKSVADAHGPALRALPRRATSGSASAAGAANGSLLDLVTVGLASDTEGRAAVDAVLSLRDELVAIAEQRPVLFAIDDYNSLYGLTDYGVAVTDTHRRLLTVQELPLAHGMRLLERHLGSATALCANSASRGVSPRVRVPLGHGAQIAHLPRYSEVETAHALAWYAQCAASGSADGAGGQVPTQEQARMMRALTNGNGAEVRRLSVQVSMLTMPGAM